MTTMQRVRNQVARGAVALLLSGVGVASANHDTCTDLEGTFVAEIDASPSCTSPVGFCTVGVLEGDIEGVYAFTMLTQTPVGPPEEARFTFTGLSTITTEDGVIYAEDTGEIMFSGDYAFMTFVQAVGGDECFEDVSGSLLATGNVNMATGQTIGTYEATFCDAECLQPDPHWTEVLWHALCELLSAILGVELCVH